VQKLKKNIVVLTIEKHIIFTKQIVNVT